MATNHLTISSGDFSVLLSVFICYYPKPKTAAEAAIWKYWQARRDSNPQHPVLETGALPIELLAYTHSIRAANVTQEASNNQVLINEGKSMGYIRLNEATDKTILDGT